MSERCFFVTGTDTGVGKTLIASGLLTLAAQKGLQAVGFKPVAAGAHYLDGRLVNDDALALSAASTLNLDYEIVNPVALEAPVAPHVAAQESGIELTIEGLARDFDRIRDLKPDVLIVEGAGGWLVPINASQTLADFCVVTRVPVILVVGLQLGCLNHALLTADAIARAGATLAGWVANRIDPEMAAYEENLRYLTDRLPADCLGVLPYFESAPTAEIAAGCLRTDGLF